MSAKRLIVMSAGWLPFVAAPAYLVLLFWVQPADQLGVPTKPSWLGRLLYDDWDMAALALRGANAHMGRTAGRVDAPREVPWEEYFVGVGELTRPYRPTYHLEYPHACLILFRFGYLWQLDFQEPPAAVCDGAHAQLAAYPPLNDHEKQLWRQFRRAMQSYLVVFVACQLGLLWVLRKGYEPGDWRAGLRQRPEYSGPIWLCVLPAALYFTLNRFDIVPTLFTALSLLALGRKHWIASAMLLATATALKVYPAVLAPLVASYLWEQRECFFKWMTAYAGTLAALLLPVIVSSGWQSFWGPYQFQLNRYPEGATIYGYILPFSWAGAGLGPKLFRLGTVLAAVALLMWGPMHGLDSLLRRGALALIVFVALPVFYSPQWLLWFLPLVVPLAGKQRWLLAPLVLLDLVTYLTFPATWDHGLATFFQWSAPTLWQGWSNDELTNELIRVLTYLRFAILAVLFVMLAWPEVRAWREAEPEAEVEPLLSDGSHGG